MRFFLTGASGFLGKYLLELLCKDQDVKTIYLLLQDKSRLDYIEQHLLNKNIQMKKIVFIQGDITKKNLDITENKFNLLLGNIDKIYHLAALYDLNANSKKLDLINHQGTKNTLEFAQKIKAKSFDYISSIAVAGNFSGKFFENDNLKKPKTKNAYYESKYKAELHIHNNCNIVYKIFRPGIIVGSSIDGYIEKVDGIYYIFNLLSELKKNLPAWFSLACPEGGILNLVPVDYVAKAIHKISKSQTKNDIFHITDSAPYSFGQIIELLLQEQNSPKINFTIKNSFLNFLPKGFLSFLKNNYFLSKIYSVLLEYYKIPKSSLEFINYKTFFDNKNSQKILNKESINCPNLKSYIDVLYQYWDKNKNIENQKEQALVTEIKNKHIVLTGATSGIGLETLKALSCYNINLTVIARDLVKLDKKITDIKNIKANIYKIKADFTDERQIKKAITKSITKFKNVDIIINNAGFSIRRDILKSNNDLENYKKLMQINYFAPLSLILSALDSMKQQNSGHIINISSIGVLTKAPKFSGYIAAKSALENFSYAADAELDKHNIKFTNINMPLVATPMINPVKIYKDIPTISSIDAKDLIMEAIIKKPKRIATKIGIFVNIIHAIMPSFGQVLNSESFEFFNQKTGNIERKIKFIKILKTIKFK